MIPLPRIAGHRQGCTTDCPGDAFYAELPSIRPRVAALTGPVATATIGGEAAAAPIRAFTSSPGLPTVHGWRGGWGRSAAPRSPARRSSVQKLEPAGAATTSLAATTEADGRWVASLTLDQTAA